ncbi:MAG: InlB B-repeat-containing protein [Ruminiclostridium sp.]|nr:InlB B-repeat-containing protein [Ruminiclostridium sp.]
MKNMKRKITGVIVAAATVLCVGTTTMGQSTLGFLPGLGTSASAATGVDYINAQGQAKTVTSYTAIKSSTTKLTGGWYTVSGKVTIDGRLRVTDDSYIILTDGAKLIVKGGIGVSSGVKFNVYTQSDSTAELYAGTTTGSNVTADSGYCGIGGSGAKVNIVGGNVYARGGSGSYGIQGSDIHLYWTNPTDSIYASSYSSKVQILSAFVNVTKNIAYDNVQISAGSINGVTLSAARVVTSTTQRLDNGNYVVFDSIRANDRMTVSGNVDLYLANGGSLTADEGITVANKNTLSIYGEGRLFAGTRNGTTFLADDYAAGIGSENGDKCGKIVIYNGNVTANGGNYAAGIGGSNAEIEIRGGKVTANGGSYGAGIGSGYADNGADIRISGGIVNAVGGTRAAGIGSGYNSSRSDITLGYTNAGDKITASSYSGSVRFTSTMYTDDGQLANASNIDGRTLSSKVSGYTVSFESNGAGYVAPKIVPAGQAISAMPEVYRAGYILEGWYTDSYLNNRFNERSAINANMTLYAKWVSRTYTVQFESNGAGYVAPKTVQAGQVIGALPTVARAGYIFDGWYTDKNFRNRFSTNNVVNSNLTLYAKWVAGTQTYTVQFESNGAGYIAPKTVQSGQTIAIMPYVEREGYVFDGWYTDKNFRNWFNADKPVTSNLVLYAKWTSAYVTTYTVQFETNGAGYIAPKTVAAGSVLDMVPYVEKSDYIFDGWYTDSNFRTRFNANSKINSNLTLYAKWTSASRTYTVQFESNGAGYIGPKTVAAGSVIDIMPYVEKSGYTFDGWFTDSSFTYRFNANSAINSDLTLFAKWSTETVTVSFNANGGRFGNGGSVFEGKIHSGEMAYSVYPSDPVNDGFTFVGWYYDASGSKAYKGEALYSNTTLYAAYTGSSVKILGTVTVDFITNCEETIKSMTLIPGEVIQKMPEINRQGYVFKGWYLDEYFRYKFDEKSSIFENIKLYALWEEDIQLFTITFTDANGNVITTDTVPGGKVVTWFPSAPTIDGCQFSGWYNERTGLMYNYEPITSDTTLRAFYMEVPSYDTASTFSGGGLVAAIAAGVVALGGGFAAGMAVGKKKKD